ncbi:hypothetical protein [Campylobacter corcagiensis]|uniref:Uncharacterized protein n=1 Tax=Campylobacter corcagiensis TaxID=1448857 RepID=A0A6M8MLF9_9BACT|nr:hypothetical protein [Campylobacter corcagiensis]QKF65579.1 hypothetical protein CCORG_a0043 [Campylobacter corcagiensis]QOQ86513.1 hypothetical protein IMC76_00020 [Campylobacter corcagiensis]
MFIEDKNNITSLDTKVDIKIYAEKFYLDNDKEAEIVKDTGTKIFTEIDRYGDETKFTKYLAISLEGLETTIDNKNYKWSKKDNLVVSECNDYNIDKFFSLDFENKLNFKKELQKSFIEEFEKAVTNQAKQLNLYDFFNEIVTKKMTEFIQDKQNTDNEENTQNSKEEVDCYYVLDENTIVYSPKEGEEERIKVSDNTFEKADYRLISKEDKIADLLELLQYNTFDRTNMEMLKSDLDRLFSLDDNTMLFSSLSSNYFIPLETDENGKLTQERNPNAFNILEDIREYENEKQNVSLEDNLENIKNLSNDFNNIFSNSDDNKSTQENKNSNVKKQR